MLASRPQGSFARERPPFLLNDLPRRGRRSIRTRDPMAPVDRRSAGSGSSSRGGQPPRTMVFAGSGEYWAIGYANATFPLKDVKGLSYVRRLLQHPGEEFHSLDLLNGPVAVISEGDEEFSVRAEGTDRVGDLGDAGEMVDAQAKLEYKRRLVELKEQL